MVPPPVAEQEFPDVWKPVALQTTAPSEPPGAAPPEVLHPVAPVVPPAEQLVDPEMPPGAEDDPAAEQGVLSPPAGPPLGGWYAEQLAVPPVPPVPLEDVEQPEPYPVEPPPPPPPTGFWFVEHVDVAPVPAPAVEQPFAPPTPVPVEHPFGPPLPDVETGVWAKNAVIVITTRPSSWARVRFADPSARAQFSTVAPTSTELAVTSTLERELLAVSLPKSDASASFGSKAAGSGLRPDTRAKQPRPTAAN